MDVLAIARALHVLGVVVWIGGVGMITAVILPAMRSFQPPEDRVRIFESLERRFAWIARAMTLIVGATGFYMVDAYGLWDRFGKAPYWWMDAMVAVWAVFTLMLFVAEPLFLHRRFVARAKVAPDATFAAAQRLHWVLLIASLVTILGAVAGAHGFLLFQ